MTQTQQKEEKTQAPQELTTYNKAPLPFVGQKRNFIKKFLQVLDKMVDNNGEGWTIVDVFGGSGLLAHNAKRAKPQARVIFNDFDNYRERLDGIEDTNRLRVLLLDFMKEHNIGHKEKLPPDIHTKAKQLMADFKATAYLDEITLTSWMIHSAAVTSADNVLNTKPYYNRVTFNSLNCKNYLDGLEIVRKDYKELMEEFQEVEEVEGERKILFIVDPPYLETNTSRYVARSEVKDFWTILSLMRPPYIFFSSTKSPAIAHLNYIQENPQEIYTVFKNMNGYDRISRWACIGGDGRNNNAQYEDNLLYKK